MKKSHFQQVCVLKHYQLNWGLHEPWLEKLKKILKIVCTCFKFDTFAA